MGFIEKSFLMTRFAIFFLLFLNINQNIYCQEHISSSWYRSAANDNSNKYININQISKNNIKNLEVAWTFHSGVKGVSETTPIFTGKYLITASANFLFAIEPQTGKEIWRVKFETDVAKRGLAFFKGLVYLPSSSGVYSVDASSGEIKKHYGNQQSLIPPVFSENSIITGNYTSVESYNIETGKLNWSLSLIKDNVTARLWSGMSFDKETGFVFIVTSNSGYIADADFKNGGLANSVIAIDAKNGKIVWQFQEIKHDLWDLDIVGQPIIANIQLANKVVPSIIAVTKSGNTLFLNRKNGILIYGGELINIPKYHDQSKFTANQQLLIKTPEPFSNNYFNLNSDITNISVEKHEYVKFKLRHARSDIFLPVSTHNDIVMFGLHGGAEWPGAALDPNSSTLVVPSNKYPWVIRAYPFANNEEKVKKMSMLNRPYMNKCAACHGVDLKGGFLWESYSDLYFPPLVDTAARINKNEFISSFKNNHKYINQIEKTKKLLPASDGLKRIFDMVNNNKKIDYTNINYQEVINSVKEDDLDNIYMFLTEIKKEVIDKKEYSIKSFWQLLLDQDGMPGSNPPYGYLTAIDLINGQIKWQKPFGTIKNNKQVIKGDMNHGGVMITGSNVIFAGGTRDSIVRAFELSSGEEIWKASVPASASAPPMSYYYKGCQYIAYTVTGGIFVGYKKQSDATVAFKLNSCN
ncbi:hypothetical protein FIT83_04120 [Candidatus Methylopumilus universalis]|jgi:quinoprotein glucose dehydrogenase|nr:hypothetical protein FIT83_04120 [Candidatus Methylopumilus universalis]